MSSLAFPTNADTLDCGAVDVLDDIASYSVLAWIYPTTLATNQRIYNKGAVVSFVRLNGSGQVNVLRTRATTNLEISAAPATLATNKWCFVAATVNTAGVAGDQKIYGGDLNTDVSEVGSYAIQNLGSGALTTDAAQNVTVSGTQFLSSRLGVLQVYPSYLTLGQIRRLQYRMLFDALDDCEIFIIPDRNSGTIPDRSGKKNHATIAGTPTLSPGVPLPIIGMPLYTQGPIYTPPVGGSTYYYRQNSYV